MKLGKDKLDDLFTKKKEPEKKETEQNMLKRQPYYKENKKLIKMSLIAISFSVIVYAALKIASFFILSGAFPNFINKPSQITGTNENNENNEN